MLKEGDQGCGDTHNLVRRDIHEIDILIVVNCELVVVAAGVAPNEFVVFIHWSVCLRNDIFILGIG